MSRNTREALKRYAVQAENDLDRALANLLIIKDTYGGIHPEHAQAVEAIMQCVAQVQELLTNFKVKHM